MNIDNIKKNILDNINRKVEIKVFGMRNKTEVIKGHISSAYPNIFTVMVGNDNKSFRYADILTGDISVKYL